MIRCHFDKRLTNFHSVQWPGVRPAALFFMNGEPCNAEFLRMPNEKSHLEGGFVS